MTWEIDETIYIDNEGGQFNQVAKDVYVLAYWQLYREQTEVKVNYLEEGEKLWIGYKYLIDEDLPRLSKNEIIKFS